MFRSLSLVALLAAFVWTGVNGQCQGSASYSVFNVCTWTSRTHPTDYPDNAHFSPMCGTVHNEDYVLFTGGNLSTDGLQLVAETGECGILEGEIDMCVAEGSCAVDGYFSWVCDTASNPEGVGNGVCSHSGRFTVTAAYPYISLVSMIAPSPDWFIGASNLNLCVQDPETGDSVWADQFPTNGPRDMFAYDAGTDSGPTFLSPDQPTTPHEPITIFNQKDSSNIFYNQETGMLNPLCRMVLIRTE